MDGMRDAMAEGVRLLVGQTVDVNLGLVLDTVAEAITVTSSGVIEASRSAAASYIDAEEIENYPILGRDFKQFALLTPTVQNDPVRGFVTMAGQRGIYTGLNIDGTSGKNAFFGYGTGGEAHRERRRRRRPGVGAGVPGGDQRLYAGDRRQRRRLHQRHHQVGHQQLQGQRLLPLHRRFAQGGHPGHSAGRLARPAPVHPG